MRRTFLFSLILFSSIAWATDSSKIVLEYKIMRLEKWDTFKVSKKANNFSLELFREGKSLSHRKINSEQYRKFQTELTELSFDQVKKAEKCKDLVVSFKESDLSLNNSVCSDDKNSLLSHLRFVKNFYKLLRISPEKE